MCVCIEMVKAQSVTFLRLYLSTTAPAKGEIKMDGISEKNVIWRTAQYQCKRRKRTSANCVTEPVDS